MNFNKILTAGATLLALVSFWSERAAAQDTLMTMSRASLLVPRTALQPVKSIDKSSAYPIDTLDTGNPAVKILLLEDYTWKYYKDPSVVASAQVYKDYWNEELPNPYRLDTKDLQDDISLWVVDSLSEYHCPYQTKVYSPFGYRHGRRHMGVDLPLKTGTPVVAAFTGKVRLSKYYRGYGNLVVVRHDNGLRLSMRICPSVWFPLVTG